MSLSDAQILEMMRELVRISLPQDDPRLDDELEIAHRHPLPEQQPETPDAQKIDKREI
jgi:hypothetical protein